MSLHSKLQQLYIDAVNYCEEKEFKPLTIINDAADIYVQYEKELPDSLKEPLGKCLPYINQDFEENYTFSEYCEIGDTLIEDLMGYIGEYLS